MARKTPELNLTPELSEVRSTDFNLFYRPEAEPVDKSIEIFTRSIDNFVNNAGTAMVLNAERKEKEVNDADALKQFNENRTGFNEAVKKGEIPKEANPYFLEKYKELTLNKKAKEFQANVYQKYAELNVLDNPDPEAFDKFYNDQLKEFMGSNNLGTYDALQLEKGFFTETSKTRNSLFNTHVNSQMSKISEDYKTNFKEGIQGKFDKGKSNEEIGSEISDFIKDATKNGISNNTAQKYLLESLMEYAETTGDLEFAERLLRELPNNIQLGTGALGDVKGLQNDFDAIKEKIDDRINQRDKDEASKLSTKNTTETFEASDFADKYETYSDAILDKEFNTFSRDKQNKIFKEFESREIGFDSQTDPRVTDEINKLIKLNKYKEARDLLSKNIPNVTAQYFEKKKEEIQSFEFTKKDGLLASEYYSFFKNKISGFADLAGKSKFNTSAIDVMEHEKFEATMRKWLTSHPIDNFENPNARETAFDIHVKAEYDKVKDKALEDGGSFSNGAIQFDSTETDSTPIIVKPEELK